MSTRGAIGFHIDGEEDKITMSYHSAFPKFLGKRILNECKTFIFLPEKVKAIKLVNNVDAKPTSEDIALAQKYNLPNTTIDINADIQQWYYLLYNAMNKLSLYYIIGLMPDNRQFLNNSLFCEWAYIVNLTTNKLEVYRGFRTKSRGRGRYCAAVRRPKDWKPTHKGQRFYYPVALKNEYDLYNLPDEETFINENVDD